MAVIRIDGIGVAELDDDIAKQLLKNAEFYGTGLATGLDFQRYNPEVSVKPERRSAPIVLKIDFPMPRRAARSGSGQMPSTRL
jgi:hypothetical protein